MTPQQRHYARKRDNAECYWCPLPAVAGRTLCPMHRDEARARNSARYHANREQVRLERAAIRYGLSITEAREIEEAHGGVCGLCGQAETVKGSHGKIKRLAFDHDHETGKVRGMLCNNCNRAIGLLKDDPELLERAARWVRQGGLVS